ncbi:phage tail sheath family protein [Paenibacillus agilis]|uniref:Phage tail protein n=1 Tax=Paenibacillus agilis TaxID=3020863 RepID=A0A559IZJ1_9BACL|nr:phage tail protein [Paenibacillus agilis]TVX93046.1 phage tail protein [Paenibacillus agilis]
MAFKHGVYVNELEVKQTVQNSLKSSVTVFYVTAPLGPVQTPVVIKSFDEGVKVFGYSKDFETYTVSECLQSHFGLYGQSHAIFINVADKAVHKKATTGTLDIAENVTVTDIEYPNIESVKIKKGTADLVKGTDYSAELNKDGKLVITILAGSSVTLPTTGLALSYDVFDPTKVKGTDFIGAVDATTGKRTGFELFDTIVPKLHLVPSVVLAPKFSVDAAVATAMRVKSQKINGLFKAITLVDVDSKTIKTRQKAIESKPVGDPGQLLYWPKVMKSGLIYHMSTHMAGVISQMDLSNQGIPYTSPSNRSANIDGLVLADGTPVDLGIDEANELNGAGISTMLSFIGGQRAWGNRTSIFPDSNVTSMKDVFIHAKRMMFWIGNRLITETWANVDANITRRFIEMVVSKHNMYFNSLVSMGAIIGGECTFSTDSNPASQIIEGKIRFHVRVGFPGIGENIQFDFEFDTAYIQALELAA